MLNDQEIDYCDSHSSGNTEWMKKKAFARAIEAAVLAKLGVQKPVDWIPVSESLPKAKRGVSYGQSLTDVVLVRHSDRPDYPITAHACVGKNLGAGIAIPTNGASEHPEIAWYSASAELNNPFNLKNDDYGRFLPKIFGSKITHWKPIDAAPVQHDMRLKNLQDSHNALAEAHSNVLKENALLEAQNKALLEALKEVWLWMENQYDGQSKGGHATFDMMMLREHRDIARAAIAAAEGEQK